MKVVDLENKERNFQLKGRNRNNQSSLHNLAKDILVEIFPSSIILEEVKIPIRQRIYYYLDLFVPKFKLAVEVQGPQHYKFNSLFHKNKKEYLLQIKRDNEKAVWCANNNITLTILDYRKSNEWANQIRYGMSEDRNLERKSS